MPKKPINSQVQVVAYGGEKFVSRLKSTLPEERFIISRFSVPLASGPGAEIVAGQDKAVPPAIMIVDLSLKMQEGLSFCLHLRNDPVLSLVPLVAVISEKDFGAAELALAAGASGIVMKPIYNRNFEQKLEFLVYSCRQGKRLLSPPIGVGGVFDAGVAPPSDGCDRLTGIPGPDFFRKVAAQRLRASQKAGTTAVLLLINLDHFRRVKSILGKDVSDELLQRVAKAIERTVSRFLADQPEGAGQNMLMGRHGQDEFLVLISGIGASHNIEELARALLSTVSKPDGMPDPKAYLTARIGITTAPADGKNIEILIQNLESLTHYEGRQPRDSYRLYASGMKKTVARRFELEAELSQAMHQGDLTIHYQPEVNIRTGSISGAEALVRWQHPQLGMLAPEAFIAVAEDVGLITEIGDWVLRQACLQCSEWHKMGYGALRISINISPYQFSRVNMRDLVERALSDAALPPEYLTLEVTESLIIEDIEKTLATMLDLKRMGVRLALDDFGTGYSSLSYLHSLSVDYLKIDRAFVKELPGHAGGVAVTEAIARMAKALGLGITAEGVENQEQLQCLRVFGVDSYQGYYFSEPLPADEFTSLLGGGSWKIAGGSDIS